MSLAVSWGARFLALTRRSQCVLMGNSQCVRLVRVHTHVSWDAEHGGGGVGRGNFAAVLQKIIFSSEVFLR